LLKFLILSKKAPQMVLSRVSDQHLRNALQFGIGLYNAGLNDKDRSLVEDLFAYKKIHMYICYFITLKYEICTFLHLKKNKLNNTLKNKELNFSTIEI